MDSCFIFGAGRGIIEWRDRHSTGPIECMINIEDVETQLIKTRAGRQAVKAEKLTGDNIYRILIYFEKLYAVMNEVERRQLMEEALISTDK